MTPTTKQRWPAPLLLTTLLIAGCKKPDPVVPPGPGDLHGEIAAGISAPLGEPLPTATEAQRATFERGRQMADHRFSRAEGLGPAFNVSFCGSCHERPVTGGGAGLYRNFFLSGVRTQDGAFFPGLSAGNAQGVVRLYSYSEEYGPHPEIPSSTNVIAQRNPIPFFGTGLLAEIESGEILKRADPDDLDGNGVSGRPNYDRGFVGRFGRKAQTVSIEGFIRGPLFNHLGITSDPLSEAQKAMLPVDSSGGQTGALRWLSQRISAVGQASAPDAPLTDDDGVADPEIAPDELFDLVSFAMLMAAPAVDTDPSDQARHGQDVFDALRCYECHSPRINSKRGPLPVYSDLLLHDMGEALADGLEAGEATGSEFRTQPLWGIASVGPYLHDGRATTLHDAVAWHGGEAQRHADAYLDLSGSDQEALWAFMISLGGADQYTPGLVPVDAPIPDVGEYGGPVRPLSPEEESTFLAARTAFDTELGLSDGVGAPRYNGDSCRACHFEPVIGGSGPRGVNVIRHGIHADAGFQEPDVGTILHRSTILLDQANRAQEDVDIYELRQTPSLLGVGLIDRIADSVILEGADPDDLDGDGISGRPAYTANDRLGKFGWKAQIPDLEEFVRDAVSAELGMTVPPEEGMIFGITEDSDSAPDPEYPADLQSGVLEFMQLLGPPPRKTINDQVLAGEDAFGEIGCAACHTPRMTNQDGVEVALYSDLLLHDILPPNALGIVDGTATMHEFRTAPLWGLSESGPYFHTGEADTIDEAILLHDGEAAEVRARYQELSTDERASLLSFLESL